MAFCNKLGSLLRQSITNNISHGPSHFLDSVRYMSSKLFVGGLSYNTNDDSLKDAFSGFGTVSEAKVITDRETGRSRGFGFVSFDEDESASSAISGMDGKELDGRAVRVSQANERPSGGFRSGGGGGYGGGGDGGY